MNALRLLLGTLTVLPVRPPARLDRATAATALVLAPLAGLVLAVLVLLPLVLLDVADLHPPDAVLAVLVVGALALLTRGLHLDGLADTADGLGSGRRGDEALAVMRRSDIGPFGVVALVVVLLLEAVALTACLAAELAPVALLVALVASRTMLAVVATAAFPAARADGLGVAFAGSVTPARLLAAWLLAVVVVVVPLAAAARLGAGAGLPDGWAAYALLALGLLPGPLLARHARQRLGGVTGDVYGATVEVTFVSLLATAALAA